MADLKKRDLYDRWLSALRAERQSFISHYKDLSQFVQPRRGRFFQQDRNKGEKRHNEIINGHATDAHRTATAGMFNGIMSPSRPWVILETDDPDLREFGPVKEWFFYVQEDMRRLLNRTNLYNAAPVMIGEEILFGTGCMSHEDDADKVARFHAHTVGSYMIAQNDKFEVDTVAREIELTVKQIIRRFSSSRREISKNISEPVRRAYDLGNYHSWYPVVHFVHPNEDFVPDSRNPVRRRFRATYYEPGNVDKSVMLEEKGFDEFPFYCPRWETTGEDVYGTNCPGMTALGDVRQLQLEEKRKGQGIDKMVSPPLQGPPSLKNVPVANLPGGLTTFDPMGDSKGLRSIYDVRLPINELMLDIEKVEERIDRAFYVHLFRAISDMQGVQPRNQLELTQRNQERLLELGPVLERQFNGFLDPLVSRLFNQMVRAGRVPPPPPDLVNRPLVPRFVSTLALAQQATITGNIDRLAQFVIGLAAGGLDNALAKFDAEQAVDEYSALIGAPPKLIVPDEVVAKAREAQQQQAQMEQALQQAQAGATALKTAADTKLEDDSAASRLIDAVGGGR